MKKSVEGYPTKTDVKKSQSKPSAAASRLYSTNRRASTGTNSKEGNAGLNKPTARKAKLPTSGNTIAEVVPYFVIIFFFGNLLMSKYGNSHMFFHSSLIKQVKWKQMRPFLKSVSKSHQFPSGQFLLSLLKTITNDSIHH